jgi:hypothetical protein
MNLLTCSLDLTFFFIHPPRRHLIPSSDVPVCGAKVPQGRLVIIFAESSLVKYSKRGYTNGIPISITRLRIDLRSSEGESQMEEG